MKNETFSKLMEAFAYKYDLRPVFDDFLTMSMCSMTPIPGTGKSHYEDLYLTTIEKYKNDDLRFQFPKLFAQLVNEMENRKDDSMGNDVLGEYYEQHFSKKNSGQFFTPMHVCDFMASSVCGDAGANKEKRRIIDPTCGSGRMLLAGGRRIGKHHQFYGIDLDHTCVMMTAVNLFLNGAFHSEIMCANVLNPDDFRISYSLSLLPFGIFRIEDKSKSQLWHMCKNTFDAQAQRPMPQFPAKGPDERGSGTQLQLF